MAINTIQMQPSQSLSEFLTRHGTEAGCEAAPERARWPRGFFYPHCQAARTSRCRREGESTSSARVVATSAASRPGRRSRVAAQYMPGRSYARSRTTSA